MQTGRTEKIGNVVLDYSHYPEQDFYCDGASEDALLELVKTIPPREYPQEINKAASWEVLYHLSDLRENIVGWLPVDKSMKVLEIGSGCGAITGSLAQKAGSVTCVDLSKKRSLINAYRHQDCDNVTIHVGNFSDIEPDLPVWKDYARAAHIHSAILSYLELHPQNFYQINADVDGTQFVTARGWEDLSNLLNTYESLGLQADEELIRQYIQHQKIAEDFSAYLDLYYKYRDDYGVEDILAGQAKPAAFARLLQAPFDEKLSLVNLILSGLETRFSASRRADAAADSCYAFLRETKKAFAEMPAELAQEPNCWAQLFDQMTADYEAETQKKRTAGLLDKPTLEARLQTAKTLRSWEKELLRAAAPDADAAFKVLRTQFGTLSDARDTAQQTASAALEAAFDFMEQAFAESQEMVVFVTELTLSPAAHAFIAENGCERYFQYNKDLLLDHRKAALNQELEAEQRRHGML